MANFVKRGPIGSHLYTTHSRWYRAWHFIADPVTRMGNRVEHGAASAVRFAVSHPGEVLFDTVVPFGLELDLSTRAALAYAQRHGPTGYVCRAAAQSYGYAEKEIEKSLGRETMATLKGFVDFALQAIKIEVMWIAAGGVVGGAAGAALTWEVGGEGAVPGAELGAEFGADIGELFVKKMGLEFLYKYLKGRLPKIGGSLKRGLSTAWRSNGDPRQIDIAARQLGHSEALIFGMVWQAIIAYVLEKGAAAVARLADVPGGREAAERAKSEDYRLKWTGERAKWRELLGDPKAAPSVAKNMNIALDYFKNRMFGHKNPRRFDEMDTETQINYLRGNDYHSPVTFHDRESGPGSPLAPGTVLEQFVYADGTPSNYFTKVGTSPYDLGINPAGRHGVRYVIREPVQALETRIADFRFRALSPDKWKASAGNRGGGTQFIIDNDEFNARLKGNELSKSQKAMADDAPASKGALPLP